MEDTPNGKPAKRFAAKWRGQFSRCFAVLGTAKVRKSRQFIGFAPEMQLRNLVSSDEIKQFRAGKSLLIVTYGVDAEGDSAAPHFAVIDFRRSVPGQGEADQSKPFLCRSGCGGGFEWRLCGGNEENSIQLRLFTRGASHEEMSQMYGIKRTAKESKFHFMLERIKKT